jgi:glycosyltransferase involved in cell wall biosynthesis
VRVHVLGLPHSETTTEFEHCAFTARTRDFATMLTRARHEVILYAGERNEAEVTEHIALCTRDEQRAWWPGYEPARDVFSDFDPNGDGWRTWNSRAAAAIRGRARPGDVLAVTMGTSHRPVADELADCGLTVVETGIGYSGVWAPFRVFESWAWRTYLAAKDATDDVRFFDEVIPRAYDPAAFPPGSGEGGYFLFVGRVMARKGPHIAAEACKRLGARLVIAGQGVASVEPGRIVATDGTVLEGDVEYAGVVGAAERAQLMGEATAIFTPTMYLEPFGGVSVEAQLTGTPAIVTPHGGLRENVTDATGFACSMLREFVAAAERSASLDRGRIREHAVDTWSFDALAPRWDAYLEQLATLRGAGWYAA